MAVVTIITKNNDGAGVVPSPGSLVEGELAVNTTDRKLYTLNNAGSVVLLASGTNYSDPVVIDVSSASPAVRITQRGAGYALLVEDSANPDSTPFAIDASGNVGIGTTSITEKLTVSGNTSITGALTATADSSFTSTGALLISKGTSGEQPGSPATGMIRYNTSTSQFEGYSGSSPAWKSIGGSTISNDTSTASNLFPVFSGATTGTAENLFASNAKLLFKPSTGELSASVQMADNGIFVNKATVSTSYTIAAGDNGMSAGTITLADGVTVTIADGSFWTVV